MLHLHRATRADRLVAVLAGLLTTPLDDPFAPEVISVPTRGIERWLSQRLSHTLGAGRDGDDGVCANVLFPTPGELLRATVAEASGIDPERDPWQPERTMWPLLDVVETSLDEPWLAPLATHLRGADGRGGARRLATVTHLAALFDRYARHRPAMIDAWRAGRDEDSSGSPLPAAFRWQAQLWRLLRARIDRPDSAQRTVVACERLAGNPALAGLPPRLAMFGLTRLAAGDLQVLDALAAGRELHLFLLHPSPALWHRLAGSPRPRSQLRSTDPTADLAVNRLLASWGRDAREMQLVLGPRGDEADRFHDADPENGAVSGDRAPDRPSTLLAAIQADVRADRRPPGPPLPGEADRRMRLARDDRSIEIHACHGRARQVEVLREAVLDALAADPTLEPRDVIVMCPEIETFAPLIEATFGRDEPADAADDSGAETSAAIDLRVRLADRSPRRTNPILDAVARILELAEGRVTASEVLDLAGRAAVRRRFGFDDEEISRLQEWVAEAGIRWGLDAAHRAPFRLDALAAGTWRAGLDRLLLGVTLDGDRELTFGGALPLDGVDGDAVDLAGRFAELLSRLDGALTSLSTTQPPAAWARAIAGAADALTDASPGEAWQRAELHRVLDELLAAADEGTAALAPAEVRAHLAQRLAGRPTRANFRSGYLTICTLEPMRSVPHRVVCLLGLDDGAFPRSAPRDGDDLMLRRPQIGERDGRSEDRQLLLDALLAATERLIVTYAGGDERTGAELPPAVPVGELLDAVDATAVAGDECTDELADEPIRGSAGMRVIARHPLQPFHRHNFTPGAIAGDGPWSFDRVWLAGAEALERPRRPRPEFLAGPLPARATEAVALDRLIAFLAHPVRAFLRQRLGVPSARDGDDVQDSLTIELDGLEQWHVGERLLRARLQGVGERDAILAEIARGTLPPGLLGKPVVDRLSPIVTAILQAAQLDSGATATLEARVVLDGGRTLSGTVAGVAGDVVLTATFSRVSPRQRLAAWARLLALSATWPQRPLSAVTVGRGSGRDDVRIASIPPLGGTAEERLTVARQQLELLLGLYDQGMREPLPLASATSFAYAEAALAGRDPIPAAALAWETGWHSGSWRDGEDADPEHLLVLGGQVQFQRLPSRFGGLSVALWRELLTREETWSR
ncbi:MAG: exodeoxyribonuclease V subunit gamma [Solirubrobacteraceae bacterium]